MEKVREIKIGDTIRSLDFPKIHTDLSGENACYIEGVVLEEFVDPIRQKGPYFKVKLTKRIFGGRNVISLKTLLDFVQCRMRLEWMGKN